MLKGDIPNEMILQVFIAQLTEKVQKSKAKMQMTLERAKLQSEFEEEMLKEMNKIRGDLIEPEKREQIYQYLLE